MKLSVSDIRKNILEIQINEFCENEEHAKDLALPELNKWIKSNTILNEEHSYRIKGILINTLERAAFSSEKYGKIKFLSQDLTKAFKVPKRIRKMLSDNLDILELVAGSEIEQMIALLNQFDQKIEIFKKVKKNRVFCNNLENHRFMGLPYNLSEDGRKKLDQSILTRTLKYFSKLIFEYLTSLNIKKLDSQNKYAELIVEIIAISFSNSEGSIDLSPETIINYINQE